MGIPQKLFLQWRTASADFKRFEHWSFVNKLFDTLNSTINKNVENSIFEKSV